MRFLILILFILSCASKQELHTSSLISPDVQTFDDKYRGYSYGYLLSVNKYHSFLDKFNFRKKSKFSFVFNNNNNLKNEADEIIEEKILDIISEFLQNNIGWIEVTDRNNSDYIIILDYNYYKDEEVQKSSHDPLKEKIITYFKTLKWLVTGNYDREISEPVIKLIQYPRYHKKQFELTIENNKNSTFWSVSIFSSIYKDDILQMVKSIFPNVLESFPNTFGMDVSRKGLWEGCMDKQATNYCKKCDIENKDICIN